MAQIVKNPPAMWETQVQSLGWEDPYEFSFHSWVTKKCVSEFLNIWGYSRGLVIDF